MSTIWNRAWREVRMPFCPVIITIGIAPTCAKAAAVVRLSAPGPKVVMQTPGLPVRRPYVAAMKPAACSWRVTTSSMREWRSDSTTSRFSSPGMPKMRSTPSFSSAATRRSDPLVMALGLDQHGLDVDELADAEVGALAAVARVLHAAERHA